MTSARAVRPLNRDIGGPDRRTGPPISSTCVGTIRSVGREGFVDEELTRQRRGEVIWAAVKVLGCVALAIGAWWLFTKQFQPISDRLWELGEFKYGYEATPGQMMFPGECDANWMAGRHRPLDRLRASARGRSGV